MQGECQFLFFQCAHLNSRHFEPSKTCWKLLEFFCLGTNIDVDSIVFRVIKIWLKVSNLVLLVL